MLTKSSSWSVLIYGCLIAGLGYLGYQQAGSLMSLYSGVGSGVVLIICALFMFAKIRVGSYIALTMTTLLTILFSVRYSLTKSSIPGSLAVFSAAMLVFLLAKTTKWKK